MSGNQYQADPRQALFLEYYLHPKSPTFSNALQSALRAGYAQEYSESILSQDLDWLSESLRKNDRLARAEKVFDKTLDYETDKNGRVDSNLLRIQSDIAKFIASTIGKDKYSSRQELTGKDGKDLPTPLLAKIDVQNNDSPTEAEKTQ
jgi:hypothetical protein